MSNKSQDSVASQVQEEIFFSENGVEVTRQRLVVPGQVFALAQISSARLTECLPPKGKGIAYLALVGLMLIPTVVGQNGCLMGVFVLVGVPLAVIGIKHLLTDPMYHLGILTSSREVNVLSSTNHDLVSKLFSALNQVIVARDQGGPVAMPATCHERRTEQPFDFNQVSHSPVGSTTAQAEGATPQVLDRVAGVPAPPPADHPYPRKNLVIVIAGILLLIITGIVVSSIAARKKREEESQRAQYLRRTQYEQLVSQGETARSEGRFRDALRYADKALSLEVGVEAKALKEQASRQLEQAEAEAREQREKAEAESRRREERLKAAKDPALQSELLGMCNRVAEDIEKLLGELDPEESATAISYGKMQLKAQRDRIASSVDPYSEAKVRLDSTERLEYWKSLEPTFQAIRSELAKLYASLDRERKRAQEVVVARRNRSISLGGYLELGGESLTALGVDIGTGLRIKYAQETVTCDQFGVIAGAFELHVVRARTAKDADVNEYLNECLVRNVDSHFDRFGKPDRSKKGERLGQCDALEKLDTGNGLASVIELDGQWGAVGVARVGFWTIRVESCNTGSDRDKASTDLPQIVSITKALVKEFARSSRPPLSRLYYPVIKDARWVYADNANGRTVTILGAEKVGESMRLVTEDHYGSGGSVKHDWLIADAGVYAAGVTWQGTSPLVVKFGAKVGETWTWPSKSSDTAKASDSEFWNMEFEGWESIEVPAGTYECAKMVVRQGDTISTTWYAAGVGVVEEDIPSYRGRVGVVLELMAILKDDDYERGVEAGRKSAGLVGGWGMPTLEDLQRTSGEMQNRIVGSLFLAGARICGYNVENVSGKFKQGWVDGFKKAAGLE